MNNDMNFEFELKQCFTDEAPELPEKLRKENIMNTIENDNYTPKKKKHLFLKGLSIAAALVIVVISALVIPVIMPEKGLIEVQTTSTEVTQEVEYEVIDNGIKGTALLRAESNDDLRNHFLKVYRENRLDDVIDVAVDGAFGIFYGVAEDMAAPETEIQNETGAPSMQATTAVVMTTVVAQQNAANNPDGEIKYEAPAVGITDDYIEEDAVTGSSGENYGKTNTQVENVDEADIIKNDGKYLYILSGGAYKAERRITIVNAADMEVASTIEIEGEDSYFNIQEMYVNGDRLVILASEYEMLKEVDGAVYDIAYPYSYNSGQIVSFVYDIADRENPNLLRKVSQDGSEYVSSRMIDGVLYTVSNYRVRGASEKEIKENAIPHVNGEEISCDCVYIYDYDSDSYIILTVYDTKDDSSVVTSLSVLGYGSEVYCSRDALYVANTNYDYDIGNFTDIYAFNIEGTSISYKAAGTVKGNCINQFSFDEYEGNLRVATTYYSYKHDLDVSSIYVLNKELELIGALEDIAYDEQVKSVRFMGEVGYIVTFRNTDPLFTLDLSDPTSPKIVGEVKLPGFSSYLHPVDEGYVVGLGYDGDEESADWSSVKVSLFDVSDLKNPKEVDNFVLKDVYSQALDNPKAFIYYPEENLIGFPVEHYDYYNYNGGQVLSYKLLKIENGEISSHLGYVHKTERMYGDVFRGTYIGQKLYTIDNYNVCEFDIATAEMLRSCTILDVSEDEPDYYKHDYGYEVTTPAVMPRDDGVVTTAVYNGEDYTVIVDADEPVTEETTASYSSVTITTTQKTDLYFTAKVTEVYADGGYLLEVTDSGNSLISLGTEATISGKLTDGTELTFEKGDSVKITFDGMVQETYPVKIPNIYTIEKA